MTEAIPAALLGIPQDEDAPVFKNPWEARAFAMAVILHERGVFTWPEWAEALSHEIDLAQAAGHADRGDTYYQHWLKALETLTSGKVRPKAWSPP